MAGCQGHSANLGWIAPQRNASARISMVVLHAKIGNKRATERDQQKWEPVLRPIAL
jgi:hypothetical protein